MDFSRDENQPGIDLQRGKKTFPGNQEIGVWMNRRPLARGWVGIRGMDDTKGIARGDAFYKAPTPNA